MYKLIYKEYDERITVTSGAGGSLRVTSIASADAHNTRSKDGSNDWTES